MQANAKCIYICGMEKTLTMRDAWADFYTWAKKQDFWKELKGSDKRKLYDAQADFRGTRGQALGSERIKKILTKHAPGRYTFTEIVTVNEETP